jgi:hypothetical protein
LQHIRKGMCCVTIRTVYLFEDTIEIRLECGVFCKHDCLAILLDHFKVICWVYTTLEEDTTRRRLWSIVHGTVFGIRIHIPDLFTANLKKSVTMAVDPLSVMGFWAVLDIAAGVAQELSFNLFVPLEPATSPPLGP